MKSAVEELVASWAKCHGDPGLMGFLVLALHCQKCLTFVQVFWLHWVPLKMLVSPCQEMLWKWKNLKNEKFWKWSRLSVQYCHASVGLYHSSSFSHIDVSFPFSLPSPPWYASAHRLVKLNKPSSSNPLLHYSFLFLCLSCWPCCAPGSAQISFFWPNLHMVIQIRFFQCLEQEH